MPEGRRRYAIKRHVTRWRDGWLLYEQHGGGFGTRIFARQRDTLERIRDAIRLDPHDHESVSRLLRSER